MLTFLYYALPIVECIVLLSILVYYVGLVFSTIKGVPYVPTSRKQLRTLFDVVHPKKNDYFVDLGSGDGRIIRFAAKKYGIKGEGVEVNALLNVAARLLARKDKVNKQIVFIQKDIFDYDCSKADFLYLFLMPNPLLRLAPILKKQLHPNTVVISHGFKLPGWEKNLFHTLADKTFSTYYYRV